MSTLRFIGLDVHKDTIVVAVADEGRDSPSVLGTIAHDVPKLLKMLTKLGDKKRLRVCYEAGPTGFGLCRRLKKEGIDCRVVAPSLIPQKAGLRVKTDRRDAQRLAQFLRSGDLTDVWVPDEQTEGLRDLERARDDAKKAERAARHQLAKFLLRNDRVYRGGNHWTLAHRSWLRKQNFDDPCKQRVLEDYRQAVETNTARVKELSASIALLVQGCNQHAMVRALSSFHGVQTLSAVVIAAEIGDLKRFESASGFMAFVGLVPSEYSSGQTIRRGSITRAGNKHVRRILVEAVHHYRHPPRRSAALRRRQEGVSSEVTDIAWKAHQRLYKRMRHLTDRKKHANKVTIALARELAGFIWAIGQVEQLLVPPVAAVPTSQESQKRNRKRGHTTPAQQQQG
jgi:transposase